MAAKGCGFNVVLPDNIPSPVRPESDEEKAAAEDRGEAPPKPEESPTPGATPTAGEMPAAGPPGTTPAWWTHPWASWAWPCVTTCASRNCFA
jgi:hypothetical protein